MAFQGLSMTHGVVDKMCDIMGSELVGLKVKGKPSEFELLID